MNDSMTSFPPSEDQLREQLEHFRRDVQNLETEMGRVLVGQRDVLRGTIVAMIAGGHVLLEGVPGLGKTLLVKTLAEAVDGKFARIQFTPDLMPADVTGTNILGEVEQGGSRHFLFQKGPLFANIVLADEINRATPKTQSALLEAMQEHSVTVGGVTHRLEGLFCVIATQNPLEMEGTYPLPEAQLDRFFCKILVPFPSAEEMLPILQRTTTTETVKIAAILTTERIVALGQLARGIVAIDDIARQVVSLCRATHPDLPSAPPLVRQYVRYGVSPRGGQAMLLAAKIHALLDGRYHVAREDLNEVALMVFRHRILLNFEGQADNISTDQIIQEIIKR